MANGLAQKPCLNRKPHPQLVGFHHHRRIWRHRIGPPLRFCRQQLLRVGVLRVGKDICRSTLFHNLAALHHANPVGNAAHDAKIMRDEQQA